jgi:hypothetical protein
MPIWQKLWDDWKAMLSKPKNLALRSGTGISKAIEDVKAADAAFLQDHSNYGDLVHKLDALAGVCTATDNKYKKLFTDACGLVVTIKICANERKATAKKECEKALDDIKTFCSGVANELKHVPNDRVKAEAHWHHFIDVVQKLGRHIGALKQGLDHLRTMPHPGLSGRPISEYSDAITEFAGHLPHP